MIRTSWLPLGDAADKHERVHIALCRLTVFLTVVAVLTSALAVSAAWEVLR